MLRFSSSTFSIMHTKRWCTTPNVWPSLGRQIMFQSLCQNLKYRKYGLHVSLCFRCRISSRQNNSTSVWWALCSFFELVAARDSIYIYPSRSSSKSYHQDFFSITSFSKIMVPVRCALVFCFSKSNFSSDIGIRILHPQSLCALLFF